LPYGEIIKAELEVKDPNKPDAVFEKIKQNESQTNI
jgi:hypothetical protein